MGKKKLLLVEDDQDDKMLFSEFLAERNDFSLLYCCDNGFELIQYLDKIPSVMEFPDLIIMDQNMPKMSGSQTLQSLKSVQRYSTIPVAIYTTYPDKTLIADSLLFGAIAVLAKPISYHGYQEMMDELGKLIA